MSTITDTDLQQLKDLIAAGQLATQKQIADGNAATQKQMADLDKKMEVGFANVDTKFAHLEGKIDQVEAKLEGKIDTVNAELSAIKSNQKAQDTRFWSLVFLILTTAIGLSAKLAKIY